MHFAPSMAASISSSIAMAPSSCCIGVSSAAPLAHTRFSLRLSPSLSPQRSSASLSSNAPGSRRRASVRIVGEATAPEAFEPATGEKTVSSRSILVVGGTGTLGRQVFSSRYPHRTTNGVIRSQVVRKALDDGYDVRCIVRARQNPADFLRDWGATTVSVRRLRGGTGSSK